MQCCALAALLALVVFLAVLLDQGDGPGGGACCSEEELEEELATCAGAETAGGASVLEAALPSGRGCPWTGASGEEAVDGEWSRPTHPSELRRAGCQTWARGELPACAL